MQFKDVIGQAQVKHHLVEMVQHNRLSHALLFLGKEGSGALSLAIAFAKYIVCEKRSPKAPAGAALFDLPAVEEAPPVAFDSCGTCPSCVKAAQLVHPDIHFSYPVVTKKAGSPPLSVDYVTEWRDFVKGLPYGNVYDWLQFIGAENKQGNITAQECNDIIRKLNLKSFESGYKILVMWMPEYLGNQGNKLLKLIEEPPADTLFILVAENEGSILNTILSRCQLIKVPALEAEDIETALLQKAACPPEQAKELANAADGNYREALNLLQHADEDFHSLLKDWLNATLRYQTLVQQKCIEEIARLGREKQKQFLRYFIHLLEGAIRLEVANDTLRAHMQRIMSAAEYDFAGKLNKAMTLEQKEAVAEELNNASYYIERNANAKILFHALTIKIYYIVKNNVVITA